MTSPAPTEIELLNLSNGTVLQLKGWAEKTNEITDRLNLVTSNTSLDDAVANLNTYTVSTRASNTYVNTYSNANNILIRLKTVDGPGSDLNADMLDGFDGLYYRNLINSTGVIPNTGLPTRLQNSNTITDWNTATENGWYEGTNATNSPATGSYVGNVSGKDVNNLTQTVTEYLTGSNTNTKTYRRNRIASVWSSWYRLIISEGEQVASYATATQGLKANTALQPSDIGVTVQGYSEVLANTTGTFTSELEDKLINISVDAGANVQPDWNATSGDAFIRNKPDFGTASLEDVEYFATSAQGLLANTALQPSDIGVTVQGYSATLAGTSASFTTTLKTKLDGIASGAEVNVQSDWNASSGDAYILNKPTLSTVATTGAYNDLSGKPTLGTAAAQSTSYFATAAQGTKADSALQSSNIGVTVQGYSSVLAGTSASFTTTLKTKLDGIAAGAQVNVQSDWNSSTGDSYIKNKPTLFSGVYDDLTGKPLRLGEVSSSVTDWNDAIANGWYRAGSAAVNAPTAGASYVGHVVAYSSGVVVQIAYNVSVPTVAAFRRTYNFGSWGTWEQLYSTAAEIVPKDRTITAGTGLAGGGNLSANRTITLSAGSISSLAKADSSLQSSDIGVSVQGYDIDTAKLDVTQLFTAPQRTSPSTLTSGTTITFTLAAGNDSFLTLAHNAVISNPADIASYIGQKGSIRGQQDATGGRTLGVSSYWFSVGSDTMPEIPTGANSMFRIDYDVVSATRIDFSVSSVGE